MREEERLKALKRSDSSPNLRGGGTSAKPLFEAQPFPENIFTDFAEEQMKVWRLLEFNAMWIVCAGATELPGNPEKITSRSSSCKILISSKDGVGDDKVIMPHKPKSFSHHRQGRIDFNTVNPSLPGGMDFLIHP